MGFLFSEDGKRVILLEKGHPSWLKGQWIGIGGHLDPGENALEAMIRESKEEADLDPLDWQLVKEQRTFETPGDGNTGAVISMFIAFGDLSKAKAMTYERIQEFALEDVPYDKLTEATAAAFGEVAAIAIQRQNELKQKPKKLKP